MTTAAAPVSVPVPMPLATDTLAGADPGSGWDDEEEEDGPPPIAAGDEIAPGYAVVALLRRGQDLDVYDLWSEERGCRVVGKTLRPDRERHARARGRLLREGRLLQRLGHPHVVRAYETLTRPRPLVVLETLTGETVGHMIEERPRRLPIGDVAFLGLHVASAVGYLHRQGILHLDLKPSNVIAANGLAKLLDLSLARAPGPCRGGSGTLGFMALEQDRGGVLGSWTDAWGLGALLYAAASGEDPVATEEIDDGHDERQLDQPPLPIRRLRRVPAPFAALVDACLAADPAARPTIADISLALTRLIEER